MTKKQNSTIETHPHLRHFDQRHPWKFLIIGTFPPNTALRQKMYIDYFYGNKGFLWKIIHDLYHDRGYDFFGGTMAKNKQEIIRWQHDYCVGLSDTIVSCSRKDPMSSDDADLIDITYNLGLRDYVLRQAAHLQKIIFTSSLGKNSAWMNFKKIMGEDLHRVEHLAVTGLPSPSGSANITFFNGNTEETFGLTPDFYQYIHVHRPDLTAYFRRRWELKKLRKQATDRSTVVVPPAPAGLVTEYKLWRYAQVLPQEKCR